MSSFPQRCKQCCSYHANSSPNKRRCKFPYKLTLTIQDKCLLAFQIAFDLVNNSTQQFLTNVLNELPKKEDTIPPLENPDSIDVDKAGFIHPTSFSYRDMKSTLFPIESKN